NGARQVGKTWLLKKFGSTHYTNVAYFNFDNNSRLPSIFDKDYDTDRIISALSLECDSAINEGTTLIIFDEIQECPKALTSLKYFNENAPGYHIACAGSLLGLLVHEGTGFPVGKVSTINIYPCSFFEFLTATGNNNFRKALEKAEWDVLEPFHEKLTDLLRTYYFVGGMPAVLQNYVETNSFNETRTLQNEILDDYLRDMSKHVPATMTPKIVELWNSIPAHLSQENKKFVFGHVKEGARARDYREGLTWLESSGLIHLVHQVKKPDIPLSAYADASAFKVFIVDIGLLGAMAHIDARVLLERNTIFSEFKGAFTEQYVCQQLIAQNTTPFYWAARNARAEIDFLTQNNMDVYAIEVKAEENLKAKSLRVFKEKYPNIHAVRFSMSQYRKQDWMKNFPLYVAPTWADTPK
ncbi:MAG: ATP-binding protein, partial [Actinomycetaceae bacterium]|nr:ATP-binding protein [Actinomycetaceae bacterium]